MLRAYEERAEFYLVIERVIVASPQVLARRQQMIEAPTREISALLAEQIRPDAPDRLTPDVYTGTVFANSRGGARLGGNGWQQVARTFF